MNTNGENDSRESEIDLLDLGRAVLKRWVIIMVAAVVGAAIAFCYSKFLCTPQYSSTAKIYIFSTSTSITALDISIGNEMTSDYLEVAADRPVMDRVIENLGLNLTYKELSEKISISNPSDSHMIYITATDSDPEIAKAIADEMADVVSEFIGELMDKTPPSILSYGYSDGDKVSPTTAKNTVIGGLIGFILAVGVFVVMYLANDRLQGPDDFGTKVDIHLIGTLPKEESAGDSGETSHHSSSHHSRKKA